MNTTLTVLVAATATSLAFAQEPVVAEKKAAPATDIVLVSMRPLLGSTIALSVETKEVGKSDEAAGKVAKKAGAAPSVKDFVVLADGTIESIVLAANPAKPDAPPALLPFADVRWDASKQAFTTDLAAAKLESLTAFDSKQLEEGQATPAKRRAYLATELLAARVTGKDDPTKAVTEELESIWFLTDKQHTIAFAGVKVSGKQRLLPWSVVEARTNNGRVGLNATVASDMIAGAPVFAPNTANAQPTAELRSLTYRHFMVATPKWERASGASDASSTKPEDQASGNAR